MIGLIVFLMCMIVALGVAVLAAHSDVKTMTISNGLSLVVLAAYVPVFFVFWLGLDVPWLGLLASHGLAAAFVFILTFALYAFRLLGAADSKLLSAYALWAGLSGLPALLFYTTLAGGVLGLVALAIKRMKPFTAPQSDGWIAKLQAGEAKVPYGVAIAVGVFTSFALQGYFDWSFYQSFLR